MALQCRFSVASVVASLVDPATTSWLAVFVVKTLPQRRGQTDRTLIVICSYVPCGGVHEGSELGRVSN